MFIINKSNKLPLKILAHNHITSTAIFIGKLWMSFHRVAPTIFLSLSARY